MKKLTIAATCGLAAFTTTALASPSMAAEPSAPVTGNLQHAAVRYWCDKGVPNFALAVRSIKTPETSVSAHLQGATVAKLGPVTTKQPVVFFALKNLSGETLPLTIVGDTTKSTFNVDVAIPKTCAGLPNSIADATTTPSKPTTTPSAPSTTTTPSKPSTAPSKPSTTTAPSKPTTTPSKSTTVPSAPSTTTMPAKPTMAPSTPAMPTTPATAPSKGTVTGPKVQTDQVSSSSNSSADLAAAGLVLAAGVGGSVLVRRRTIKG